MGTARVKQEEEADKNNARVVRNLEERNVGTKWKSPKQGITTAKDLPSELPEGQYIYVINKAWQIFPNLNLKLFSITLQDTLNWL